jgi:hypothetical protein
MAIVVFVLDLLINALVVVDTLGLVVATRKNPDAVNTHDMERVCFTWICFAILTPMLCCTCGIIGTILSFIAIVAKLWIGLPKLGGSETIYKMVYAGGLNHYVRSIQDIFTEKIGCTKEKHD